MKIIIIKQNQDIISQEITSSGPKNITLDDLKECDISSGTDSFRILNKWGLNNYKVYIYGCTDGVHNQVNQHDLPPPLDNTLCFGDLILSKVENNKWVDFTEEDYIDTYDNLFGGFDDLGSEDSFSDDDSDGELSDDSFIVNDIHSSDEDDCSYVPSDDNLDNLSITVFDIFLFIFLVFFSSSSFSISSSFTISFPFISKFILGNLSIKL